MHPVQKVLIQCSAAVDDVLARPECRGDATRYAMVGGFVLLTACFAFISGTFALYTGFRNLPLALPIGMLWAVMIFTIDRYVVSGIRKADTEQMSPIQRLRTRTAEWITVLPRMLLAAVISFVVATPLEIKFFEPEINAQISRTNQERLQQATTVANARFPEIEALAAENRRREADIVKAREKYESIYDLAVREGAGQGLTKNSGDGPVYKDLKKRAEIAHGLWKDIERNNRAMIATNMKSIDDLRSKRSAQLLINAQTIAASDGFLARYSALGKLAEDDHVRAVKRFMTLLFLVLELTPVLMKMMIRRGSYDEIIDTIEHIVKVKHMQARSDLNDDVHTAVAIHSIKNAELIALQERLTREAYDYQTVSNVAPTELEDAQRQLARASINDWLRNQLKVFGLPKPRIPIRNP